MIIHEEGDGPGAFAHSSRVYVWHDDGMSVGLHIPPEGVSSTDARPDMITNMVYGTLRDVNEFPKDNVFVTLHHMSKQDVKVTVLPVGSESNVERVKAGFEKGDELFRKCLDDAVEHVKNDKCVAVRVMYNKPSDLTSGDGELAIVHEAGARAEADEFLAAVAPVS